MSRLEKSAVHLKIFHGNNIIADTIRPIVITEKLKPPVYYFPPENVNKKFIKENDKVITKDIIGIPVFYNLEHEGEIIEDVGWSYPDPDNKFEEIEDYIAFNPAKFDACYINGELVQPVKAGMYVGWSTIDIDNYN